MNRRKTFFSEKISHNDNVRTRNMHQKMRCYLSHPTISSLTLQRTLLAIYDR